MNIPLSLIRPSPHPVRSSWDEGKMEELAQSIREQGVVVPVKVRPAEGAPSPCVWHNWMCVTDEDRPSQLRDGAVAECNICDGIQGWLWPSRRIEEDGELRDYPPYEQMYEGELPAQALFELVYGHRRVEAARRAGLEEMPAIVEGMDDVTSFVQALIENIQREDMEPLDTGRAIAQLKSMTGWKTIDLERRNIMNRMRVLYYERLLEESPAIQSLVSRGDGGQLAVGKISPAHVEEAQQVLSNRCEREGLLHKAAGEGLTAPQTRRVAGTIARTESPERRKFLLETPYSPYTHDPETAEINEQVWREAKPTAQSVWDEGPDAKVMVLMVSKWRAALRSSMEAVTLGKLAPEGKRFLAKRLRTFAAELIKAAEGLEE